MIKKISIILLFLCVLFIIYNVWLVDRKWMYEMLEIKIPIHCHMDYDDRHSGFRGEGETLAKVYFNEKQIERIVTQINQNDHWKELPMLENLRVLITEKSDEFYMKIPDIKNGYWIFKDRHSEATDIYNALEIFYGNRYSDNFSVGIIDLDSNVLYFYQLDT